MNAYAYQAALWCERCAIAVRERLGFIVPLECREDSNEWPNGPHANGGGEADTPQHCDGCGEFLRNPLTYDGVAYVCNAIAEYGASRRGSRTVLQSWCDFYAHDWPGILKPADVGGHWERP